jgi:hypothetical protein
VKVLSRITYKRNFELLEDGSSIRCQDVASKYGNRLDIAYYYKRKTRVLVILEIMEMTKARGRLFYHFLIQIV